MYNLVRIFTPLCLNIVYIYILSPTKLIMHKQTIQCGDLQFQLLYTREQIDAQIQVQAERIDACFQQILAQEPGARFLVLGVLNGAFMFTSEVVRRLKTPVQIDFIKIKSYKGTVSGELTVESKLEPEVINNSHVLILDDICDTGKTLVSLVDIIKGMNAKSVRVGVLVIRPDKTQDITPEFVCVTCSAFIIGYGLDYKQEGRQYPQIYQKI